MRKKPRNSPGRLLMWPSNLTASGWRVAKWPTGKSYVALNKISPDEDEKLRPTVDIPLTKREWKLSLDELVAKFPYPGENPSKRTKPIAKVAEVRINRNTREV
jgi:hypothetical protein